METILILTVAMFAVSAVVDFAVSVAALLKHSSSAIHNIAAIMHLLFMFVAIVLVLVAMAILSTFAVSYV